MMLDVLLKGRLGDFDLDVAFEAGSGVTALFGPSGAGKTSILRGICGHWVPEKGHVVLDGVPLFARGEQAESKFASAKSADVPVHKRDIGVVFQAPHLFPHMTVRKNILYSRPGGSDYFDPVVDMLDLCSLLDRMPRNLSGGEAQRVAIGRTLISDPQLLLLDEPMTGLDGARRDSVFPYLEQLCQKAQVPILYVSHNRAEIERLARRVLMIDSGRIVDEMSIFKFASEVG